MGYWWDWPGLHPTYYRDGSGPETHTYYYHSQGIRTSHYISYLKFDLSSISDDFIISSATLNLYATSSQTSPYIYKAEDDWDEEAITWLTKPDSVGAIADRGTWTTITDQWVSFDLYNWTYAPDLADDALTIALYAYGNDGSNRSYFATKEYPDPDLVPYLQITGIPEPATIVLLGFGSLALLRRKRATYKTLQ